MTDYVYTPAVRRAAMELPLVRLALARRILAAALDVEEMAAALYLSEHPYDTIEQWRDPRHPEQSKAVYRRLATDLRASILGEP